MKSTQSYLLLKACMSVLDAPLLLYFVKIRNKLYKRYRQINYDLQAMLRSLPLCVHGLKCTSFALNYPGLLSLDTSTKQLSYTCAYRFHWYHTMYNIKNSASFAPLQACLYR